MERRKFIRTCSCATAAIAFSLPSCTSVYYATSTETRQIISIPVSEFKIEKNGNLSDREFVFVKSSSLRYPICVHKVNESYVSSLMMCTHNQCELNAGGGIYSCPCHGSEFSVKGEVLQGPAEISLTTFRTELIENKIRIYLA